ncbi:phosphoglycerate dehydrogenase [Levilactobacillus enshiensis]|uniref:phosphoglycerate dehydrogenase n=1 Tax=Levilactobacillus enshiensis TaxID=2590213 RepID=UPI00117A6147|nr:phosphoglycerate dehydrogenase [Levilactobacillus enshiensis]
MNGVVGIPQSLAQAGKDYLTAHGLKTVELTSLKATDIAVQVPQADALILLTDPFDTAVAARLPNLKIIARHGVGIDNVDPLALARRGVWVTNTPNANASTVAETTLAEILDVSKNVTRASIQMRRGNFAYRSNHMGFDLSGKRLGIMGYGRIGRLVAQKASVLGMTVLIYDPTAQQTDVGTLVDRETLLRAADIVTLHMAVTPENKRGIDARSLALMKKSAVLINLGRGVLIDTPALIAALKSGELSQAALDVYDEEPLPMTSELYQLDNVLLTPHIASNTFEARSRMARDAASEVVRVLAGDQPQWPVNRPAKPRQSNKLK